MIPYHCRTKHNPPETYGDCIRACVNTMLSREDAPHVFDSRASTESWIALRAWLKTLNKNICMIGSSEDPRQFMKEVNPDVPYLLLCCCGAEDHAVVCINDQVFHDPAWYKKSITGPTSEGYFIVGIMGVDL